MTIIDFIRLIRKHIVVLIIVPVIMVILVIILTRNPAYKYSSETSLYTGIASGSSVEMDKSFSYFANNTAFDNLINIVNSRHTQQEVAIRLLAQHLLMDNYDPKYISAKSFNELKTLIPPNVRKLVVKKGKQNELNVVDSMKEATNDSTVMTESFSFEKLDSSKTISTRPGYIDENDFEATVRNLETYMKSSDTNSVYKLLYYEHPHYSIRAISKVNVQRIASSDMVKIRFESDDPGICQQTLALLTEVCIRNYRLIKENRSDAVVRYFEHQLRQAAQRLKVGEDKLLQFNEDNNIINYYEQSKAVAVVKEDLDVEYNNMRIKLAGYEAAIKRIEEKLGKQKQVQLSSNNIIDKRNKLSQINASIATSETIEFGKTTDEKKLSDLKQQAERLKDEITNSVNDLYSLGNTPEGLPLNSLLNDWLANVISYEDTKAGMKVLSDRIQEFQKQYAIYAPAGANIKRIEREISVSEQEFLEILHGLNLAKLKLQDVELSSTIKTVDPPYYPLSPNPTKRKLLVIAAALIGFLITLSLILGAEYFDETLRHPARAAKIIKLRITGMFPKILLNTGTANFTFIVNRLTEMFIHEINQLTSQKQGTHTRIIIFTSTGNREGKTVVAGNIARKLLSLGYKVIYLSPENEQVTESATSVYLDLPGNYLNRHEYIEYNTGNGYLQSESYKDLMKSVETRFEEIPDYIFIEIPSLINRLYPPKLVASADLVVMVCRANRTWMPADERAVNLLKGQLQAEPVVLLNGVDMKAVETMLGDLPKKRSRLRRVAKNFVRLQFYSRQHP